MRFDRSTLVLMPNLLKKIKETGFNIEVLKAEFKNIGDLIIIFRCLAKR